jgi:hypothetical protein
MGSSLGLFQTREIDMMTPNHRPYFSPPRQGVSPSKVLVLQGERKEREKVQEHINGTHDFDLTATPYEADAEKLAGEHPYLSAAGEGDDLFRDDETELPPDDSNPFDHCHLLKEEIEKAKTAQPVQPPSASATRPRRRFTNYPACLDRYATLVLTAE